MTVDWLSHFELPMPILLTYHTCMPSAQNLQQLESLDFSYVKKHHNIKQDALDNDCDCTSISLCSLLQRLYEQKKRTVT